MNEKQSALLEAEIGKLESLSSAPVILQPLLKMLNTPTDEISVESVVGLISRDGAIAAQCLRMANSPLFGRRQVDTVRSAIMTLGIGRVRSLLLGLCMNQTVPKDKWVLDANAFWRHSFGCALVTQTIATGIGYHEPEKAYLAGLIHDIGMLANSVLFTSKYRECMKRVLAERCPIHIAEEAILGFTHENTGRILGKRWGFPEELLEVAGWHHKVELVSNAHPLTCLVHLADLLCRVRNLGYGYDEVVSVGLVQDTAWKPLAQAYPKLSEVDLVRFTLDLDDAIVKIAALVDSVFAPPRAAAPATR